MIFNGADEQVIEKVDDAEDEFGVDRKMRLGNAIEMAIIGQSKRFIKSAAAQKIIGECVYGILADEEETHIWLKDGIWSGRIIYSPEGMHSILSDVSSLS